VPRVNLRALLDSAAMHGYAHPAFNVNTLEQCHAVLRAATAEAAPAILQFTALSVSYLGPALLPRLFDGLVEEYRDTAICFHLDHGLDVASCFAAIENGFTSVMIDASLAADLRTPRGFEENVALTGEVVRRARQHGVSVEGALGIVGSLSTCLGLTEEGETATRPLQLGEMLTNPIQARQFAELTGIDALAVAIGTTHGLNKFSSVPSNVDIKLDILEELHHTLPETHFVVHGASKLPARLQDTFREFGGDMAPSNGVSDEILRRAVSLGVRKVNIDTDNRLAMSVGIRRHLAEHPENVDPRRYLSAGAAEMEHLCRQRYRDLGTSGWR
jgi:fructose-bisphosphate aldolase class II